MAFKRKDRPLGLGKRARAATKVLGRVGRTAVALKIFNSEVHGRENIPEKGVPAIFVSNHISFMDALFVWPALRRVVVVMTMAELWDNPRLRRFRWLLDLLGIPVKRDHAGAGREAHALAARVLDHRGAVLNFGEGKIPPPEERMQLKTGPARLALETGALMVPVWVSGTNRVLPMKWDMAPGVKKFDRRAKVIVRIGTPFDPQIFGPNPDPCVITQELQRRMKELEAA